LRAFAHHFGVFAVKAVKAVKKMAKKEKKYYVVWKGRETGVFDDWESCREAVNGYEGALYKAFPAHEMAEEAYRDGNPYKYLKPAGKKGTQPNGQTCPTKKKGLILNSISVDAACNMVSGIMEYQGVYTDGGQLLFHKGPFEGASNNIGEFLAIVHALAWCRKNRAELPVYSDSNTAIAWVRKKKANTRVVRSEKNQALFDLINRAEIWLVNNMWNNPVLKWDTASWGEIPADFNRK